MSHMGDLLWFQAGLRPDRVLVENINLFLVTIFQSIHKHRLLNEELQKILFIVVSSTYGWINENLTHDCIKRRLGGSFIYPKIVRDCPARP